jgi:ABC-2 type transport system ATP-binding protein
VEPETADADAQKLADSQATSRVPPRAAQPVGDPDPLAILSRFDALIEKLESDSVREKRALQAAKRKALKASVEEVVVAPEPQREVVLSIRGLVKHYGDTVAVDGIDLDVEAGSIFGIVGPNGAGKTTTLSMVTGLLRPDAGTVTVHGANVWHDPATAKRQMGVLPDRLRLFDRLTGNQLLYYSGVLRGLPPATVRARMTQLAAAFGLEDALGRLVTDYSAGMTKKLSLAAALIHSPRLLVLDEPFESVDPVSAANVTEILQRYVAAGGTVVLSSHSMDLIQRICDAVAIIVSG